MRGGLFLVLVGILIILIGIFGNSAIGDLILWIFAIGFAILGVEAMIRWGFPRGLVSLSITVFIVLHLTNVLRLGFWRSVFAILGVWLVEIGLERMMGKRFVWFEFNTRRRRF